MRHLIWDRWRQTPTLTVKAMQLISDETNFSEKQSLFEKPYFLIWRTSRFGMSWNVCYFQLWYKVYDVIIHFLILAWKMTPVILRTQPRSWPCARNPRDLGNLALKRSGNSSDSDRDCHVECCLPKRLLCGKAGVLLLTAFGKLVRIIIRQFSLTPIIFYCVSIWMLCGKI